MPGALACTCGGSIWACPAVASHAQSHSWPLVKPCRLSAVLRTIFVGAQHHFCRYSAPLLSVLSTTFVGAQHHFCRCSAPLLSVLNTTFGGAQHHFCRCSTPLSAVLNTTFVGARLTAARLHHDSTHFLTTLSRFQKILKSTHLPLYNHYFAVRNPD
jgi:hypothetical protein